MSLTVVGTVSLTNYKTNTRDYKIAPIASKRVIYFILIWTIVSDSLIAELGAPHSIEYLNDAAIVFLSFTTFFSRPIFNLNRSGLFAPFLLIGLFWTTSILSAVFHGVDVPLLFWAIRNLGRFFVFMTACVVFFEYEDVNKIFKYFYYLQIVSFFLALYQYLVLGYHMDDLGGVFGHGNGAALNTFQAMMVGYYLADFLNNKRHLKELLIVIASSFIIAALAEEKAFFIYFVLLGIVVTIFSRPSFRTVLFIFAAALIIPVSINLLASVNESWNLAVLTNLNKATDYLNNSYGLSRIDPFSQINKLFFNDNFSDVLFGLGLGSAEYCESLPMFTSNIFRIYNSLQYFGFTHQMLYIQVGAVGFIAFIGWIAALAVLSFRRYLSSKRRTFEYLFCAGFCLVAIVSCWFANAVIFKDAFLIYFAFSVYGILKKGDFSHVD